MESQFPRRFLFGAVAIAHRFGPQNAGGAILGNLLKKIVMGVEKEAQTRREIVYRQAAFHADVNVMETVGQGEGQFLYRRGTGLADVVAADADRVPLRDMESTKLDDIRD